MNIPSKMTAMVMEEPKRQLKEMKIAIPAPKENQILIKVEACAVCRTDLHIFDGELSPVKLPLILGHEITGTVVAKGEKTENFTIGQRVGVPWLGYTCQNCYYCKNGAENLCDKAGFTGYTIDGGFAEYTVADQRFCIKLPDKYDFISAAPLLCAGLIGYRSYRVVKDGAVNIGIYGFGAAAHILTQIAVFEKKKIFAFTRKEDIKSQKFALELGAVWSSGSNQKPPELLDAAIIFAPAGELIPIALENVRKGGFVVCGGIHMSDIPSFPYKLLWGERTIKSIANLTRKDGEEFFSLPCIIKPKVNILPLTQANIALDMLREGKIEGAIVLKT
jgi:propanol-preferring alcohol dehydrogenase